MNCIRFVSVGDKFWWTRVLCISEYLTELLIVFLLLHEIRAPQGSKSDSAWFARKNVMLWLRGNRCTKRMFGAFLIHYSYFFHFGPRIYPRGSLVIAFVCWFVCWSVFKYLWVRPLVLIFCLKLGHHKGTKVTESVFWNKILGVTNGGKTPFQRLL